jgi:hypothetical protein
MACSTYGARRNAYRILVGKLEGKKPLGKHTRRWEDNIKIYLIQDEVIWIELIWLRIGTNGGALVNTEINLRAP